MNTNELKEQRGVSLIEVLILLVVLSIMVSFTVAQLGSSKQNFQRQNLARELKVNLERARFDSVKRRPETEINMSKVVIDSATAFTVFLDLNQDGIASDSEKRQINFSRLEGVKIVGDNLIFPITVKFDRRGHITVDGTGTNIVPSFTICDKGCSFETAEDSNSNTISVSQTGTVTMTGGGEAEATFNNPTVTNVNPCEKINSWVTVANISSPPAGCATPTPTPTPSSSPSGSPSTSPTPRACNTNERPQTANCVCQLPKTVRSNGKCI